MSNLTIIEGPVPVDQGGKVTVHVYQRKCLPDRNTLEYRLQWNCGDGQFGAKVHNFGCQLTEDNLLQIARFELRMPAVEIEIVQGPTQIECFTHGWGW